MSGAAANDQPLIEAINDVRKRYPFSDAAAERLFNDFANPDPALRQWIFDLCDPSPRADLFPTRDMLAGFTRYALTKDDEDGNARWADLAPEERRLARRIKRFWQEKRVWMGPGRPQKVDRALILYVIRRIEETTGVPFRFSRLAPRFVLGGPMLRLAEAALLWLFHIDERTAAYLGLVSPARHYKRAEIARTAELARRASNTSPAKWSSDLILGFTGDVRLELMDGQTMRK
jgi:hypothetical protein